MKHSRFDYHALLEAVFSEDPKAELRSASVEKMLLAAQRSRRRRRAIRAVALCLIPAMAVVAFFVFYKSATLPAGKPDVRHSVENLHPRPSQPAREPGVRIINDQELLALFSDRPVAIIGPPGRQKLVVFDNAVSQKNP